MRQNSPLFTIATVTYNAAETLQRTLDSVANQDYPYIEHLLIDGCSSDGTIRLVQRYVETNTHARQPHQIRLVCERDEGLYDAMNKALQLAQGDYIVFLNSGDMLHATDTLSQLTYQMEWIKGDFHNPAILYGQTDLVDQKGHYLRPRRLRAPETLTWKSFRWGMLVCHQSFYVRTDIAREEHYNLQYHYSADFDWCIRLLRRVGRRRMRIINTRLILTDYLSEGLTTRHHRASLFERMRIMMVHYGKWQTLLSHLWFVIRGVFMR